MLCVPCRPRAVLPGLFLLLLLAAPRAQAQPTSLPPLPNGPFTLAQDNSRVCLTCHGMPTFGFRDSATLKVRDLSVHREKFTASVHGKLRCQQCHEGVTQYPHPQQVLNRTVGCGDNCHATDSAGRAYNHARISDEFAASAHGRSLQARSKDGPTCTSCHGKGSAHEVVKARKVTTAQQKMELCVNCHADEEKMARNKATTEPVSTYRRSFHYKAIHFGQTNTAVCQDCHTAHGVLAKDSARSSINPANLPKTCGQKACHPGAEMNFSMSGFNHLGLRIEREPLLWGIETFFIVLTAGSMLMLVIGIILDVQKKFGWFDLLGRGFRAGGRFIASGAVPARAALRTARRILID